MPYKLTPKQHKAAKMVAEGAVPETIEKELHMRRYTLNRWRRLKPFQDVVKQHIKDMEAALPLRIRNMHYQSASALCDDIMRWGRPSQDEVLKTVKMMDMAKKLMAELPDDMFDLDDTEFDIEDALDDIERDPNLSEERLE